MDDQFLNREERIARLEDYVARLKNYCSDLTKLEECMAQRWNTIDEYVRYRDQLGLLDLVMTAKVLNMVNYLEKAKDPRMVEAWRIMAEAYAPQPGEKLGPPFGRCFEAVFTWADRIQNKDLYRMIQEFYPEG
jgi:hypothetical protein